MSNPHTARDATVKMLLGEFGPLLDQLDDARERHAELQAMQAQVHDELSADLANLGGLMNSAADDSRRAEAAARSLAMAADRMERCATRIEAAAANGSSAAARVPPAGAKPARQSKNGALWAVLLLCLVLAVWAIGATWWLYSNRTEIELGKATRKAWPALNAQAKRTIQASAGQ